MTKAQIAERAEATEQLRKWLKPGDTVYTIARHVARSGMSRTIGVVVMLDGDAPIHPNHAVATALGYRLASGAPDGVKMTGCGMDMGFALVYELGRVLWPDGYGCTGEGCRSNDHSNEDRDYTPHMADAERIGAHGALCECHREHWHKNGGYALTQRWL